MRKLVTLAMTGALVSGGLIGATTAGAATQGELTAQSCYGSAHDYDTVAGYHYEPPADYDYYKATSNCADINIKTDTNRYVKVCFFTADNEFLYCQESHKLTTAGEWKVIATNVNDGTRFKFHFRSDAVSTGEYAS
ncbi:hypothetical protein [Streptomyces fulvoviolaceus]|uniref:hypothetical protein n=1 Tax=Streptomyces fulvoviolaceus TaxID=285535 RepID=UPI0021BE208C|nr:hypothetical protein [Streptomyces fulvoviolaceus]MCT9075441.1 hypothetical protein [Streptomyces fulvoviolaceus]